MTPANAAAVPALQATGDDEPSLGSVAMFENRSQEHWAEGSRKDLEDEHDGCEPDEEGDGEPDDEPALGWTEDGDFGAPTDRRNDECEDCPATRPVARRSHSDRLDNFRLNGNHYGKPKLERGNPQPSGISNVGLVIASWRVDQ